MKPGKKYYEFEEAKKDECYLYITNKEKPYSIGLIEYANLQNTIKLFNKMGYECRVVSEGVAKEIWLKMNNDNNIKEK